MLHSVYGVLLAAAIWLVIKLHSFGFIGGGSLTTDNECVCCCLCGTVTANWPTTVFMSYTGNGPGAYPYTPDPLTMTLLTVGTITDPFGTVIGPSDCNHLIYICSSFTINDEFGNNYTWKAIAIVGADTGAGFNDLTVYFVPIAPNPFPNPSHTVFRLENVFTIDCVTFVINMTTPSSFPFVTHYSGSTSTSFVITP